ncbi:carotenoid oxygenase family protein [Sphaerisporangium aureirubrum]|uniref:carotenoid oxygenase family protein n=1 Tax=Sphaerisporangium aureirubrum TaxID=1544736 RepID=UPI003630E88D
MAVTEHAHPRAPRLPRPAATGGAAAPGREPPVHRDGPRGADGAGPFPVEGAIPAALDGDLVRIGPSGRPGRPLVCGIRLSGGTARRLALPGLPPALAAELAAAGTPGGERAVPGAPQARVVARTGRFWVVYDPPVAYSRAADLMGDPLPYRPHGRPARVGLLPRHGHGGPRWFAAEPCARVVNAFDDGARVVVDVTGTDIQGESDARGVEPVLRGPRRWTLDPAGGTVRTAPLAGAPEGAAVDPRRAGRRHQVLFGPDQDGRALVACDLAAGTRRVLALAPGLRAEEPVFVPRGAAEGDGRLLVPVRDHARRRAALLVLDALDPSGTPEAVVTLPFTPPPADRTLWIPASRGPRLG